MSKKPATKKQDTKKQEAKELVTTESLAVPEYMKNHVDRSKTDTGAMIFASISVPRLSYRGKRWRFVVDGEETVAKELTVRVIIVGVEPEAGRFIKTFYNKVYAPGDTNPPDCSSSNGIAPDVWVAAPMSPRCNACPKNVFGSAVSRKGGKAKACHDSKRLWVVKPDDFDIVYGLNVPIMTLKNLAEYGKYIARNNYPLTLLITELSMDDEAEFPKLVFKHVGFVPEEDVKTITDLNERRPWSSIQVPLLPFDAGAERTQALPEPDKNQSRPKGESDTQSRKKSGKGIDEIVEKW